MESEKNFQTEKHVQLNNSQTRANTSNAATNEVNDLTNNSSIPKEAPTTTDKLSANTGKYLAVTTNNFTFKFLIKY